MKALNGENYKLIKKDKLGHQQLKQFLKSGDKECMITLSDGTKYRVYSKG